MSVMKQNPLLFFYVLSFYFFISPINLIAGEKQKELAIPLTDASQLTIDGPHRFISIGGIIGLHVSSLKTKAFVETELLNSEKGSVSLWMSPLEDMNKAFGVGSPYDLIYPLLSDQYPPRNCDSCSFSIYYQGEGYPRLLGRFTKGDIFKKLDYGLAPFVYIDDLPLRKGQWYNIVVTWDKPAGVLKMYINGELAGHNFSAKEFLVASNKLFIGNPLMVISRLKIQSEAADQERVKKAYLSLRPQSNRLSDNTVCSIVLPQNKPDLDLKLDNTWGKAYECSFTDPKDLDQWTFQTGDLLRDKFKLKTTGEGLYWETPAEIHVESRGYLWCPVNVEGDQWIEYEFQLVSPNGLSLLIIYASGMQGEDVINDHGLKKTGSMGDMLLNYRNYHWEYMRRVEAMRTDVESQYVNKNPWAKSLYAGCVPRFEQNRWYKIRFIKSGNRLYGSLDGKTVFDVQDNANDNNGPVLNSGRVVLRQMYNTAMKYRNFKIYRKKS